MNGKNFILCIVLALLATLYVIYFTDWFRHKTLHIYHTNRNLSLRQGAESSLIFGLESEYELKEIKVVPLQEFESNPKTLPVWHLQAKSHSVPMKWFYYGQYIKGMEPVIPGQHAEPLDPTVTYRIFISTTKMSGHHDFNLSGAAQPADASAAH
jgi:hypothetical protein